MKDYQNRPAAPPAAFCATPTAGDIRHVIDLAREFGCMGAIVGAPGIGKTTTLRRYAAEHEARYIVMSPAHASMPRMLARICDALGEASDAPGAARLHDTACASIRYRRPSALLADEAQHLGDAALDELRCIHDETGIPIVVAGNSSLRARVAASGASAFAQFASRIGPRATLTAATTGDVDALARHHGITDDDSVAWLVVRAAGTAGLRIVERLMRAARTVAGDAPIKLAHLKKADAVIGGAA